MTQLKFTKEIIESFQLKTPEKCMISGCHFSIDYWCDDYDIGLCENCYWSIKEELKYT